MVNFRQYAPSLSKLKQSYLLRRKEYFRENTLHGFPYFVNSRRPLWERAGWFICTFVSICAVIGIIISIMETFIREPALLGVDTETSTLKTFFPRVLLCNEESAVYVGAYRSDINNYKPDNNRTRKSFETQPPKKLPNETYSKIFYDAAVDCHELYDDCRYGGRSVSCGEMFQKVITVRGVCCLTKPIPITETSAPWELWFNARDFPIGIDFMDETEGQPDLNSPFLYYAENGTSFEVTLQWTYSTPAMESIALFRRKCYLPDEKLSYGHCIRDCQRKKIVKVCHCIPWFLVESNLTNGKIAEKSKDEECGGKGYECLIGKKDTLVSTDCGCYLSCNHTSYILEQIKYTDNDTMGFVITNWPAFLYKRDVKFGWLDLLGSFGGTAGLFIGYSLLTSVELAYYIVLRTYCGAVLDNPTKMIETKVSAVKRSKKRVIKVTDLKNNYYDYVD